MKCVLKGPSSGLPTSLGLSEVGSTLADFALEGRLRNDSACGALGCRCWLKADLLSDPTSASDDP